MNNKGNIYAASNEKALSVQYNRGDSRLAENNGYVPPVKEQKPAQKEKKKSPAGTIIIIVVVLLVAAAAAFLGYRLYTDKVSMDILEELTGTWIYDTGSENAGYVSFMGNEQAEIDGVSYTVSADKKKLVFEKSGEKPFGVEYARNGEQLMLALAVENDLFESCNVTTSPSDLTGVLLYRISDSHSMVMEDIQSAYYDRFPEYILLDLGDLWGDILSGDITLDNIDDYLPELDSADDLLDIYDQFSDSEYGEYLDDILGGEFDPSDFVADYFAGLGEDVGEYLAGELDGTAAEDWIEGIYGFLQPSEDDYSWDWGWGDYFDWGVTSDESNSSDSSDSSDWNWDWDW